MKQHVQAACSKSLGPIRPNNFHDTLFDKLMKQCCNHFLVNNDERLDIFLCGMSMILATCYLNSYIQTSQAEVYNYPLASEFYYL